jgi:hypothetical protein
LAFSGSAPPTVAGGPWFLRNLALRRHHPICPGEQFPVTDPKRNRGNRDWIVIQRFRAWQQEASRFLGRWSGVARAIEAPVLPAERENARPELLRLGRLVDHLHGFHSDVDVYRRAIRKLFPYGVDADEVLHQGRCTKILEALNAHLEKADLTEAIDLRSKLRNISSERRLPFHAALFDFCENLGSADASQHSIAESGSKLLPRRSG